MPKVRIQDVWDEVIEEQILEHDIDCDCYEHDSPRHWSTGWDDYEDWMSRADEEYMEFLKRKESR